MVSTRGIKLKFCENERVLCYEPDPTKAKVLYDSKVLDVVAKKDQRGKKSVEYLIHFQGWNSSWDRYVSEEYVLKDTPENRQLQKDLAEKSQLQLGAYLYRKDRKKHGRKTSERTQPSSDDGSSGSPSRMDTDDGGQCITSSSEDDSSLDDENVRIELTQELKECLEEDYCLINQKGKLLRLPASPNVVNILESYWRHYFTAQVCDLNEKHYSRHNSRYPLSGQPKRRAEDIQRNLSVCSEVLDGIRIYFDFTLKDLLLYKSEMNQVETAQATFTNPLNVVKDEPMKLESNNYLDYLNYSNDEISNEHKPSSRKRTLRSNRSVDCHSNGNSHSENVSKAKASSSCDSTNNVESATVAPPPPSNSLRLLPEQVYQQQPPPPCLVYGAVHLARLLVKLPELLNASSIEESKLKTLLQHLDAFVDYLNEHRDWFGEKFYVDK